MAVTLRFHGRFLYGRREDGSFSVMAPTFASRFAPHRPLMSIPQADLRFRAPGVIGTSRPMITTLNPTLRTASHPNDQEPQVLVWDLTGLRVTYDVASPVSLTEKPEIMALEKLEEARDAKAEVRLDRRALVADTHGRSRAVVNVTSGEGTAISNVGHDLFFVKADDVNSEGELNFAKTPDAKSDLRIKPADLVKFSVQPPKIAAADQSHLTLKFSSASEEIVGLVSVLDGGIVSFSNLCAPLQEPGQTDLEFVQYYDLLEHSPGMEGLVPHEASGISEGPCCVCAARIEIPIGQ